MTQKQAQHTPEMTPFNDAMASLEVTALGIKAERDALRAENARLREALEGCVSQLAQDNVSAGSRDYETALPYTLAKARAALRGQE